MRAPRESPEVLRVCTHADARAFLARAQSWLQKSEIEHAMALDSARNASADDSHYERPIYWATVEDDTGIVGCAFRTPPYLVGVTALPEAAIAPLIASLAAVYPTLPGVSGDEPTASALASAWTASHGGSWSIRSRSRQRLYLHKALIPEDSGPRGALRLASGADVRHAQAWGAAFARVSGLPFDGRFCAELIRHGRLYFWDNDERCCMLGVLRETPDSGAIGIIYTPPPLRERGYAAASVGALSRLWLGRGIRNSYLYADPENRAADAICLRLGYEVVRDAADFHFA
jgi:RimJ/RimL family protein N-acetyltransferase